MDNSLISNENENENSISSGTITELSLSKINDSFLTEELISTCTTKELDYYEGFEGPFPTEDLSTITELSPLKNKNSFLTENSDSILNEFQRNIIKIDYKIDSTNKNEI